MAPKRPESRVWTGTRIIQPDDSRPVAAVTWRQLPGTAPAGPPGVAPTPPAPDAEAAFCTRAAELEKQWQEKVRQARAAGVAEGEAAGRNRAAAELQPVLERLSHTIAEISGLRGRLRREAEADTIRLA